MTAASSSDARDTAADTDDTTPPTLGVGEAAIRAAAEAIYVHDWTGGDDPVWDATDRGVRLLYIKSARAALEAALPHLSADRDADVARLETALQSALDEVLALTRDRDALAAEVERLRERYQSAMNGLHYWNRRYVETAQEAREVKHMKGRMTELAEVAEDRGHDLHDAKAELDRIVELNTEQSKFLRDTLADLAKANAALDDVLRKLKVLLKPDDKAQCYGQRADIRADDLRAVIAEATTETP